MVIAERKFILHNSRERVWDVLLKAVMRSMPFERIDLGDQKNFRAWLKMKMGGIPIWMHVTIKIVDISEPETLSTLLKARGLGGMVWLDQKAIFTLIPVSVGKSKMTEVNCKSVAEGMPALIRMFLSSKVKSFAADTLGRIESLLKEWTEEGD